MSILKFVKGTKRPVEKMYDYICDPNKTDDGHIFGIGLNPQNAAAEMEYIQNVFFYKTPLRKYKQIVFAFNPYISETVDLQTITEVCIRIGYILLNGEKRQLLGGIHYKNRKKGYRITFDDKIHCHYMLNMIGTDGSLYRQGVSVYYYIFAINNLLAEYGIEPIPIFEKEDGYHIDDVFVSVFGIC